MRHPLIRLARRLDSKQIKRQLVGHFTSVRGRPALLPRLVAGLLYESVKVSIATTLKEGLTVGISAPTASPSFNRIVSARRYRQTACVILA